MSLMDISSFFGSSSSNWMSSFNFRDYSLIQSGSYQKLMRSYYNQLETGSSTSSTRSTTSTSDTSRSGKSDTGYNDPLRFNSADKISNLYQSEYTAIVANKAGEPKDEKVTIAGKCCESGDLIGENMPLQHAESGDILAVCATGAYNYSMSSNYNRIPKPAVIFISNGEARVVVKRETPEDIIRNDI